MDSPTQGSSPSRGLKSIFKKGRKGTRNDDSKSSLTNILDDSSSGRGGFRSSVDAALDKFKPRASDEHSIGGEGDSDEKGIGRLIPGRRRRRRKRREAQEEEDAEESRGRNTEDVGGSRPLSVDNPSRTTLDDDDGNSSLLTYDSEVES